MAPNPSKRPAGFGFLTVCSLLCAGVMAWMLGVFPDDIPLVVASRFAVGVTGALAMVTAEALWRVRPWAFSASVAFAGSFVLMPIVVTKAWEAVAFSGVAGLFIVVALGIVHRGLFPNPTLVRVPRSP